MRRGFCAIVLGTSLVTGGGLRAAADPAVIPLATVPGDLLAAPVMVNGIGPFWFLLDTGSTATLMTPGTAARAGVAVLSRARLFTPAGTSDAGYGQVDALALGPLAPVRASVVITPLAYLRSGEVPLDGVLGNDILGRLNFAIDVRGRAMTVDPGGELAGRFAADRQPLAVISGRAVVSVRAGARELNLVVDSASSRWVLFDAVEDGAPAPATILTANGRASAREICVTDLKIGSLELGDVDALQLPASAHRVGHGLLPVSHFKQVYVNNTGGWIAFR